MGIEDFSLVSKIIMGGLVVAILVLITFGVMTCSNCPEPPSVEEYPYSGYPNGLALYYFKSYELVDGRVIVHGAITQWGLKGYSEPTDFIMGIGETFSAKKRTK